MLPIDAEPAVYVYGIAYTVNLAMRAAEQQVAAWPALIEGAQRNV